MVSAKSTSSEMAPVKSWIHAQAAVAALERRFSLRMSSRVDQGHGVDVAVMGTGRDEALSIVCGNYEQIQMCISM